MDSVDDLGRNALHYAYQNDSELPDNNEAVKVYLRNELLIKEFKIMMAYIHWYG